MGAILGAITGGIGTWHTLLTLLLLTVLKLLLLCVRREKQITAPIHFPLFSTFLSIFLVCASLAVFLILETQSDDKHSVHRKMQESNKTYQDT